MGGISGFRFTTLPRSEIIGDKKICKKLYPKFVSVSNVQSLQNLMEVMTIYLERTSELRETRQRYPNNHHNVHGIDASGQFQIYKCTLGLADSHFTLLSYLAGYADEFADSFLKRKKSNLAEFLELVSDQGFPFLIGGGPIRRAYEFRSLAVHQNDKSPMNWDTLTFFGSPVFVVLRGLGDCKQKAPQVCNFKDGRGWLLAFPNEEFLEVATLELVLYIVSRTGSIFDKKHKVKGNQYEYMREVEKADTFNRFVNRNFDGEALDKLVNDTEFYLNYDSKD